MLQAAKNDPVGFVRGIERGVIDEVHRAPDLILAIKASADSDPRAGRFLLTGSANLMTLPHLPDSLAGRIAIIPLLPLSQAGLRESQSSFLEQVFLGKTPKPDNLIIGDELVSTVLAGGYPEVLVRSSWSRRQDWHLDYVESIIQRDVRDIAQIEKLGVMPRLLRVLAEYFSRRSSRHCLQPFRLQGIDRARGLDRYDACESNRVDCDGDNSTPSYKAVLIVCRSYCAGKLI